MSYVWSLTMDDYLKIYNLAVEMGIKPGQSMEPAILRYAKENNLKPIGQTELNKEEFIAETISHDKKILDISHDIEGNAKYTFIKPKDETND